MPSASAAASRVGGLLRIGGEKRLAQRVDPGIVGRAIARRAAGQPMRVHHLGQHVRGPSFCNVDVRSLVH